MTPSKITPILLSQTTSEEIISLYIPPSHPRFLLLLNLLYNVEGDSPPKEVEDVDRT